MADSHPPRERRFFLCSEEVVTYSKLHEYPDRHILGELVQVTLEGERVTAMALWDVPTPTDEVPPVRPKVRTRELASMGIVCVFRDCKRVASWRPGARAFRQLMARYGYKPAEAVELPAIEIEKKEVEAHEPVRQGA